MSPAPGRCELDLARLIASAGEAPPNSRVRLERPGRLGFEDLTGTLAPGMPGFKIKGGDQLTVTAPDANAG